MSIFSEACAAGDSAIGTVKMIVNEVRLTITLILVADLMLAVKNKGILF